MARHEINLKQLKVRELMRSELKVIQAHENVGKAVQYLWANDVQSVAVLKDGDFMGLITSQDMAKIIMQLFAGKGDTPVENYIAKQDLITISPDIPLQEFIHKLDSTHAICLPVIENDKIVGTLSSRDIMHYIANLTDN
ncbi:MAG: hypothetical protein IEMM0008_0431 [bacterium]|nr:MAG: hypothetical protein IEMM0008_0431 [bacterium]